MEYIKRPNYFNSQFLQEQDFKAEQLYHRDMRYRHNRGLHFWGVVEGLEVKKEGNREISISPGMAIDKDGHELILLERESHTLTTTESVDVHVILTFRDDVTLKDDLNESANKYTRFIEHPEIADVQNPVQDGSVIVLGRLSLNDDNNISDDDIDKTVRRMASAKLADGTIATAQIKNDAVTSEKVADEAIATKHIEDGTITPKKIAARPTAGIIDDQGFVEAPDGDPDNWWIFVSLHRIETPGGTVVTPFRVEVSAERKGEGWTINCYSSPLRDGSSRTSGSANYLVISK
ncbi:MAG: hypothetical protein AAGD25_27820 [Cyanobacteria bacterium P01_F01_bin.150]